MDWEQRCIRFCGAMLACVIVMRLGTGGYFAPLGQALEDPRLASFLVYLQTGRVVRYSPETQPEETTPEPTAATETQPAVLPVFSAADAELIDLYDTAGRDPDIEALLEQPLSFDLSGDEPTVLILHTHTSESYTPVSGQTYEQTSEFRTLDPCYNMLRIGDQLTGDLQNAGIQVLHDREFHDYPSYNGSYADAAESTAAYLEEYPSIRLVLDIHRDAADTAYGQMTTQCSVGGQPSAQLMLVVGTDSGGLSHPNWEENLSLALKLQVTLERQNPGICRNLNLTYYRYNQHLSPGALLVEIGAAGNTLDEALTAASALADGIIALFQGT